MRFLSSLTILLLAGGLGAQTLVVPSHFANAEGDSSNGNGIGASQTPSVLLSVYDDLQGSPTTLRSVAFRRDGSSSGKTTLPATTLLVNVFASTAQTTAANPSSTLAANHGPDKVQINQFSVVQLPESPFQGPAAPFEFKIPFSQPYSHAGTGPLCLEIQVTSRVGSSGQLRFDYAQRSSTNPSPVTRSYGRGCVATGRSSPVSLTPRGSSQWRNSFVTFTYDGANLPASSLATVFIDVDNRSLGGVPLPFELPGTASAPSGACNLYNGSLIQVPGLTDGSGKMSLNVSVTVNPFFNGLDAYGQVVALDASANSLGAVLSNGVQHHLVAPHASPNIGTVTTSGSLGPTGTARGKQGYVVRFEL